jgi:hypothetical protein
LLPSFVHYTLNIQPIPPPRATVELSRMPLNAELARPLGRFLLHRLLSGAQRWRANPVWGSPRIVNELRQVGIDVIKAQWAVRVTGFRPVP